MVRPLRILLVEDSENDALLLVRELGQAGYAPECRRVESREAMCDALDAAEWDLVIADHSLPAFSGPEALEVVQSRRLDLPFIVVSGTIREEAAVEAMHAGASDYIMKGNLARLIPAIERELREIEVRRDRTRAEAAYRRQRDIAETLQRSIIPSLPSVVPGIDVGHLYLPAGEESLVGGDFYDLFPLDDHRFGVVMGDVCGKGVDAASMTAMARYSLRSYAAESDSPAAVMTRLSRYFQQLSDAERFVTLFYATIDLEAGRLTYASAGHEPALHEIADGTLTALTPTGPILLSLQAFDYSEHVVPIRSGDSLLLFTDGLTEMQSEGQLLGPDRVATCFSAASGSTASRRVEGLLESVRAWARGPVRDDVAILLLRFDRPEPGVG